MKQNLDHCRFSVDRAGVRLDKLVGENCQGVSRTQAQKLIDDGFVTVDGRKEKASYKPEAGEVITVNIPPPAGSEIQPEDIPVGIVYEDDELMVIDKPAGISVHPAPGHPNHTLVNAIINHLSDFPDSETNRPGIVHRLDKDTSGLMVVAKNIRAHADLSGQFKSRTVKKIYITLVRGHLEPEQGVIEAPIGRDSGDRKKMSIAGESRGRQARTRYSVLKYMGKYTLAEITLETGRTHQIRVHLAAIGFPVVGDETYGVKSPFLSRQFLHARRLGFKLPSSGKYVEFESPLPEDLEKALEKIT